MLFAEAKSPPPTHTHTHTRAQICGMINFVRDVIWICKDRINTLIPIVLFMHHILATLAQVDFALSQTMPPVPPSVNTHHTK